MSLLRVEDVGVRFGGLEALSGVNLEILGGEIVALIGPNGAGKTTLFNTISGLQRPTKGAVFYKDEDVTGTAPSVRARLGIGRTFQRVQIFGDLSVRDNVVLGVEGVRPLRPIGSLFRSPGVRAEEQKARRKAERVIELVGLGELADRRAGMLPLGQLRRLELARALASSPELLLLDEPASGMDEHESIVFADLLGEIQPVMGFSALLVEHDMHVVNRISDYVYVLDFGEMIAEGSVEDIGRDERVLAAYLGQEVLREGEATHAAPVS